MLSTYQLTIADFYNVPTGNVKKLVSNVFGKEKYVLHYESFATLFKVSDEAKKMHRVLKFKLILFIKIICLI